MEFDELAVQSIRPQQGMIHDLRNDDWGSPARRPQRLTRHCDAVEKKCQDKARDGAWEGRGHRVRVAERMLELKEESPIPGANVFSSGARACSSSA
jgi:hypothetical protein